jgi:hypothetical protein
MPNYTTNQILPWSKFNKRKKKETERERERETETLFNSNKSKPIIARSSSDYLTVNQLV